MFVSGALFDAGRGSCLVLRVWKQDPSFSRGGRRVFVEDDGKGWLAECFGELGYELEQRKKIWHGSAVCRLTRLGYMLELGR